MLETLRKQQATWKEKEGAVDAEDRVTIDFTGSVDGEEFEGGKASDFVLAMGPGSHDPRASKTVSKATKRVKSSPST